MFLVFFLLSCGGGGSPITPDPLSYPSNYLISVTNRMSEAIEVRVENNYALGRHRFYTVVSGNKITCYLISRVRIRDCNGTVLYPDTQVPYEQTTYVVNEIGEVMVRSYGG